LLLFALACIEDVSTSPTTGTIAPVDQPGFERAGVVAALSPTLPGTPDDIPEEDPADEPGDEPPEDDDCLDELAWQLNVVSNRGVGSEQTPYSSDFQGAAATLGGFYVRGFSLNALNTTNLPFALYAGGDVSVDSGSIEFGGIEAAGDVFVDGGSIAGDIVSGGHLDGGFGTVQGDAVLAGADHSQLSILGERLEGVGVVSSIDLQALVAYFDALSVEHALADPNVEATEQWGELLIELEPGDNVVELDGASLGQVWGLTIDGPEGASVVLNVADAEVAFDSLVWTYTGGASAERTLLNLHSAEVLELSGGDHQVSILAPHADTIFPAGLVTGTLVVGSLEGGGQVNHGPYDGGDCEDDSGPM